jgi:DNA-binding transcriptional MocR family regulator
VTQSINARILAAIEREPAAPTARQIADRTGLDSLAVSRNLSKLRMRGIIEHANGKGNGSHTTWKTTGKALSRKTSEKPAEAGQVAQKRDREPSRTPCEWAFSTPARTDAADHERIPSRRGNELVQHRPLMLMGSNVRGEFGK